MTRIFRHTLARLLVLTMVFLNCSAHAVSTNTEQIQPTTQIRHNPVDQLTAGERIVLYAEVADPNGVDVVRVYFKAVEDANYVFVPMEKTEKGLVDKFKQLGSDFDGGAYTATLPAPANGSGSVSYLFLVKNDDNIVVKSQTYDIPVKNSDKERQDLEPVRVYTEMNNIPQDLPGFSDNMVFDVVESSSKFGIVAGLYTTLSEGAADSVAAGTVVASTSSMTTSAIVTASVAAIAVAGGVVAAVGFDGDDEDESPLNATSILGTWQVSEQGSGFSRNYSITFSENGRYSTTNGLGSGDWNLSQSTSLPEGSYFLSFSPDYFSSTDKVGPYSGTVQGTSKSFSLSGEVTASYTR